MSLQSLQDSPPVRTASDARLHHIIERFFQGGVAYFFLLSPPEIRKPLPKDT